jgi:hypothetical protein
MINFKEFELFKDMKLGVILIPKGLMVVINGTFHNLTWEQVDQFIRYLETH